MRTSFVCPFPSLIIVLETELQINMKTDAHRILIICTGNSCRSQMAEGFFRHYLGKMGLHKSAENIRSAGLERHGVNPKAIEVMAEIGIDISHHTSDHLEMYINTGFDFVITVCDNAARNCPAFPGKARRLHWPFDDPARVVGDKDEVMSEFRRVRDDIGQQVRGWLKAVE